MMYWRNIKRVAVAACIACAIVLCLGGCAQGGGTAAKGSVNDYTWEELSAISQEIAAAPDEAAAVDVAKSYNLAGSDGKLDGTQAKDIILADGTQTRAVIAGFAQDKHPDGAAAGITFMLEDAVGPREMNSDAGFTELYEYSDGTSIVGAVGGWAACDLRIWLNGDFIDELPADLRKFLLQAEKTSTAVTSSETTIADSNALEQSPTTLVESTSDLVWIPSGSEIAGISDDTHAAEWDDPGLRDILRMEGPQYKLFADAEVKEESANALLKRRFASAEPSDNPVDWWTRSLNSDSFFCVSADGIFDRMPDEEENYPEPLPGDLQGVVAFFCI